MVLVIPESSGVLAYNGLALGHIRGTTKLLISFDSQAMKFLYVRFTLMLS